MKDRIATIGISMSMIVLVGQGVLYLTAKRIDKLQNRLDLHQTFTAHHTHDSNGAVRWNSQPFFWLKGTQEVASAKTYQLWIRDKIYETTNSFLIVTNPNGTDTITVRFPTHTNWGKP